MVSKTFTKKVENFYAGKLIIIFVFFFFLAITSWQIYNFIFQGGNIYFFWENNESADKKIYFGDDNAYIAFILYGISFIGYFLTFVSTVFVVNHKRNFIHFVFWGDVILIAFDLMLGLFFTVTVRFFYIFVSFWNLKYWDHKDKKNKAVTLKKREVFQYFIFTFLYILFGIPIAIYLFREETLKGIFDVVGAAITIGGWYLITKKSKWGIVEYIFSNIVYIIVFLLIINSWISVANYGMFIIFDIFAFLIWNQQQKLEMN